MSNQRTPPNPDPGAIERRIGDAEDPTRGAPGEGLETDGGGQQSEVGSPYDGSGGVRRGYEKEYQSDKGPSKRRHGEP